MAGFWEAPTSAPAPAAPAAPSPSSGGFWGSSSTPAPAAAPIVTQPAAPKAAPTPTFSDFASLNSLKTPADDDWTAPEPAAAPQAPASDLTTNPLVAKITGGTTLEQFGKDTLAGLPAAGQQVSDIINTPITKASDLLASTPFMTQAAAGMNADPDTGVAANDLLQKLSDLSGTQMAQGATAGMYQAPSTGQTDDFGDTVLKGLAQGVGGLIGIKSLGSVLTPLKGIQAVSSVINRFPLVAKYAAPFAEKLTRTAVGLGVQSQLDPNLAGNMLDRAKSAGLAIGSAPLYEALGTIGDAKYSLPASFGLGFGMAKLGGADNKTALASGFTFGLMDAAGRAGGDRGNTADQLRTEALNTLNQYAGDVKLSPNASKEQIGAIYNRAVHQTSIGGSSEALEAVKSAYDLLSKGAVSNAPGNITDPEKSAQSLKDATRASIDENGAVETAANMQKELGVDEDTAHRVVQGTLFDAAKAAPKTQAPAEPAAPDENEQLRAKVADLSARAAQAEKGSQEKADLKKQLVEAKTELETKQSQKPSKIGTSIARKALDARLTEKFGDVAGYDPLTIKDQAAKASKLVNSDLDTARAIVRGEQPLPEGLKGTSLITALEEHIKQNPSAEIAHELANSPLVTKTSEAAQELRLAAEREPDSVTQQAREIKAARENSVEKTTGKTIAKVKTDTVNEFRQAAKTARAPRQSWEDFAKNVLTCKT